MTSDEVKLFEAPDLAALQRNWPRIALRASAFLLIPFCVTMLARTLDLYPAIAALPLPLTFLAQGPFAYEGKVIFAIVATFLALAFLMPKRTPQLVIGVCVGGVLWTGHIYISLQWARLFATQFNFRRDAAPEPLAWLFATLLLTVGVLFLIIENLLDTRQQQETRSLSKEETRAAFDVAWRMLGIMVALGAAMAAALVGAYLLLRALLADAALPFRLNPVFVLFGMGLALAILVALAARKRDPVAWIGPAPMPASVAAGPVAALSAAPTPSAPLLPGVTAPAALGLWARMMPAERVACVLALGAIALLFVPWTDASGSDSLGLATTAGAMLLIPALATLVAYPLAKRNAFHRFGVPAAWALALAPHADLIGRNIRNEIGFEFGAYLGLALAVGGLAATLLAARRNRVAGPTQA